MRIYKKMMMMMMMMMMMIMMKMMTCTDTRTRRCTTLARSDVENSKICLERTRNSSRNLKRWPSTFVHSPTLASYYCFLSEMTMASMGDDIIPTRMKFGMVVRRGSTQRLMALIGQWGGSPGNLQNLANITRFWRFKVFYKRDIMTCHG